MPDIEGFRQELTSLINRYSLENLSNTPDFILADYLVDCLETYSQTVTKLDTWYGRNPAALAALGQAGSFTIKRGTYTLHVYKNTANDFTVDLDPHTLQEAGEDPQP